MEIIKEKLKNLTIKWLKKIEKERKKITIKNKDKETQKILKNIDAYINDCRHFNNKNMPIEAFEAVIYAYGMFDTLNILERNNMSEEKEPEEDRSH